jgi:hypothetical protein
MLILRMDAFSAPTNDFARSIFAGPCINVRLQYLDLASNAKPSAKNMCSQLKQYNIVESRLAFSLYHMRDDGHLQEA